MKKNKYDIACIAGLIMMIIGAILNIVASIKEFGAWGFFSKPSINETKILFSNQTNLVVPGLILAVLGFLIITYIEIFKK